MPTGTLPAEGKKIWERVHDQALADGDSEETAAQKAWGAVKNAGWHKNGEGQWVKRAELEEFSLTIRRATLDSKTGEMRWRADASDIDSDSYDDNMSFELFSDFLDRINRDEAPPEQIKEHYVTDFWPGGMPYLSLSHYPDLNGDAVPGVVDAVFMDGKFFKAKGRLLDNDLGRATWQALKSDLEKRSDTNHTPVRISIAFLDYKHMHKDTGTVFERDFSDPLKVVCSECVENRRNGKMGGKVFLKGQLIHLAMTRVPVNKRTLMEVERSMTTRKEDAASIVGEALADQIDEKALAIGKSEAEVIRAEEPAAEVKVTVDPALESILNSMTVLSQTVSALAEEVRAMKPGDEEDMETCKACGGSGKVKKATKKAEVEELAKTKPPMEEEDSPEDAAEDEQEMKDKKAQKKSEVEPLDLVKALSEAMAPTNQKLDILISATSQKSIPAGAVPERRSLAPGQVTQLQPGQDNRPQPGQPMKISDVVRRSVMGQ